MRIGIIVYSQTGHTQSVAEKVKDRLSEAGHEVDLKLIGLVGGRKSGERVFEFEALPDPAPYEGLVFGSAVEAFSLSPVMSRYLAQLKTLEGKSVACLVSQQFPFPWMGGNHAIRQMTRLCRAKGATVRGSAVVNWAASRRERTAKQAVERLGRIF
jgi:hypothetical protein